MSLDPAVQERLALYHAMLLKWQRKINLISPQTVGQAWERHFDDSLQLVPLIRHSDKVLFDFGSGAGFPGLVLAIACPHLSVHLFESDQKKCSFLRTVSRETHTDITLYTTRIEQAQTDAVPDIITARALAPLADLFRYAEPWLAKNKALRLIFPKGAQAGSEIAALQAGRGYGFDYNRTPSRTNPDAVIFEFSGIYRKVP